MAIRTMLTVFGAVAGITILGNLAFDEARDKVNEGIDSAKDTLGFQTEEQVETQSPPDLSVITPEEELTPTELADKHYDEVIVPKVEYTQRLLERAIGGMSGESGDSNDADCDKPTFNPDCNDSAEESDFGL